MKQKVFRFVIGDNPYENSHGDREGNGTWHTTAPTLEEALYVIFGDMDFPGEATGRKTFVPGISIPLVHENDVIQIWSTVPEVVAASNKAIKGLGGRFGRGGYHDGKGSDYGLHMEILITQVEKFCHPERKLLAAPVSESTEVAEPQANISPMGASVIKYQEIKHEIKLAAQQQKMEVTRKKWELDNIEEAMNAKMKQMQEQIGVFDAYLHGTRHRTQIAKGNRGKGKYHVYQQRVFLSEEVALLGNFADMDFKDMEKFESWLVKSGHIWKLLPFERCVLATRIRQEKKDYGNPLANLWNNYENMQNMIWIRDGENVFHVDVEFDFHNAVFPHKDQFDKAKTVVQNSLFLKAFKLDEEPKRNFHGDKVKNPDVMGKVKHKPLEEELPYCTKRILHARFKKMEDWLACPESYTELLDKQVNDAVHEYLRERNKQQMLFAVIMQGIVDHTKYLDIPPGTDMFNWESVNTYLELLFDYTHGLPFKGWSEKVAPFISGKVTVGDWIVAEVEEWLPGKYSHSSGTTYKEKRPMLFKVLGLEAVEKQKYISTNHYEKYTEMKPVVRYHPRVKRHDYRFTYEQNEQRRNQQGIKLVLKTSEYIRVPMSPQYAKDILDDREWKKAHADLVPMMVNYNVIIQAMKTPVNGAVIKWDNYED